MNQSLFKIASALLCYPEPELLAALDDIAQPCKPAPRQPACWNRCWPSWRAAS
jgi:nitrate reductase assembly molybdenum cofactor insertion protein NarJ